MNSMDIVFQILGVVVFVAFVLTLAVLFRRIYRRLIDIWNRINRY